METTFKKFEHYKSYDTIGAEHIPNEKEMDETVSENFHSERAGDFSVYVNAKKIYTLKNHDDYDLGLLIPCDEAANLFLRTQIWFKNFTIQKCIDDYKYDKQTYLHGASFPLYVDNLFSAHIMKDEVQGYMTGKPRLHVNLQELNQPDLLRLMQVCFRTVIEDEKKNKDFMEVFKSNQKNECYLWC